MSGAESYITVTLEIKWTCCDVEIEHAGFKAPVLIGTIATKWVLKKRKVPKSEQF